MVMVSFKRSFMFCLFYRYGYVSFKRSFIFCLFYLYGYGVVQVIFCFLLVLSWLLWCRSRELLLFVCFVFMVMVSFKGSFVVCLFNLIVMLSFKRSLFFAYFFFIVMVSFKGSFVVCLFYLYGYGVVHGIFCCLFILAW